MADELYNSRWTGEQIDDAVALARQGSIITDAEATTLAAGSAATATVEDNVLKIGVPKGDKGDTGEVDYSRLNDYAKLASPNNMLHNGNEFTFIPDGYAGQIYINHRTASGQTNGNVSNYYFGDGKGGLATFIAAYFKGRYQGETARPIYNNEEAAMLSDVPTKTKTWTLHYEDGATETVEVYVK